MKYQSSKRHFLKQSARFGLLGAMAPLGLQLAGVQAASLDASSDYKALVCLFLYGGNDAYNTFVPYDQETYNLFSTRRRNMLSFSRNALAETLLKSSESWESGREMAMNPALAPLKPIHDSGKLATVMNVGTLLRPTTLDDYKNKLGLPPKLMSHNDQFTLWQSMRTEGAESGWGGRMGDLLMHANEHGALLTNISMDSSSTFSTGRNSVEYMLNTTGVTSFSDIPGIPDTSQIRQANLYREHAHIMDAELRRQTRNGLAASAALDSALSAIATPTMPNTLMGQRLGMVARAIGAYQQSGSRRQIFFVPMGGYDTHNDPGDKHNALWVELAGALASFQGIIDNMGMSEQVTTFTSSDFGRSLISNGGGGSDHGWGGHHLVMGGAVTPFASAGKLPSYIKKGADDIGQGRLLPSVSVDQYGATLARWMGVAESELSTIFPNIGNFASSDLGFMKAG